VRFEMRRLAVLALVLMAAVAPAALQTYTTSVTAVDTNQAFEFGFGASSVMIANDDTTNEVFIAFDDPTATTSDFKLLKGESVTLDVERGAERIEQVSVICSSTETAAIRILAHR